MMELSREQRSEFLETLWSFYGRNQRELPWRVPHSDSSFDPYEIMVSELMLQQTQVARVVPKYHQFLQEFPTAEVLADSDLGEVLRVWQGLGYNRRAKFLWLAAKEIQVKKIFPSSVRELVALPGIGTNTAGAILAYAYNQPALFVETNVRTAYIHHFFPNKNDVSDKEIIRLLDQTMDRELPRQFYWALMDYGSHLKATVGNLNKASKHYTKQSKFNGSRRQLRGQIIRTLGKRNYTLGELHTVIPDERLAEVLHELVAEDMVRVSDGAYAL